MQAPTVLSTNIAAYLPYLGTILNLLQASHIGRVHAVEAPLHFANPHEITAVLLGDGRVRKLLGDLLRLPQLSALSWRHLRWIWLCAHKVQHTFGDQRRSCIMTRTLRSESGEVLVLSFERDAV